jgi:hypothetical protein
MTVVRIPAIVELDLEELIRVMNDPVAGGGRPAGVPALGDDRVEFPPWWRRVEERHGVRYTWGRDEFDLYDPFIVYEGRISDGIVRLAIGKCERTPVHSEDRIYYIVCAVGPQGGLRAIAEFLATDDYDETGDVIAIIKGKDGTGRMFDSGEELPAVYSPWQTVTYRDRVDYPGSYTKQGLVCSELDHEVMLNHALAQIQLRGLDS